MPNPYFSFKQFTVYHDRCAMKVGTDGVLLGAWVDVKNIEQILDVGTGSGLVALMLAQRSSDSVIDTIEIDSDASEQAKENFKRSPFPNISGCYNDSFQKFVTDNTKRYDMIVSNPPFFSNSLKSSDVQRSLARHDNTLFIDDFISMAAGLLTEKGKISFIFPYSEKDYLLNLAISNGLYVSRMTSVYPTPESEPKRILLEFSVRNIPTVYSEIIIEKERHVYSHEFIDMVKDFYLKM